MRLTGSRCLCRSCGEYFNSISTFDGHRRGDFLDRGRNRRCLTPEELLAKGWSRNLAGFWIERAGVDRTRRSDDRPLAAIPHEGAA